MINPIYRQVAPFLLANAAAVVYTYDGSKFGKALISALSVCNTDSVTRTFTLSIVPAGGTITDAVYRILDTQPLLTKQTMYLVSDSEDTGIGNLTLKDGDRIVMFASAASVVATRLSMHEYNSA